MHNLLQAYCGHSGWTSRLTTSFFSPFSCLIISFFSPFSCLVTSFLSLFMFGHFLLLSILSLPAEMDPMLPPPPPLVPRYLTTPSYPPPPVYPVTVGAHQGMEMSQTPPTQDQVVSQRLTPAINHLPLWSSESLLKHWDR